MHVLASALKTFPAAFIWVAVALLVALGVAGITATMNRVPGTPARAELTWLGEHEAEPALDSATDELEQLAGTVDELSATARDALSEVTSGDLDALQARITAGTLLLDKVDGDTANLRAALGAVPHAGDDWPLHVSPAMRHRYDELEGTAQLTAGLEDDWAAFAGRALDAATMSDLLARHDEETAKAAAEGTAGRYAAALTALNASDATIAQMRALRDGLARTSDVAVLTGWIDRNAAYDAALRHLYRALVQSKGRVTDPVRKAFDGEREARAQLPKDTGAVVVIMSDIAQGGLNQAVISIEEARGALAEALDVQQQLQDGASPAPG